MEKTEISIVNRTSLAARKPLGKVKEAGQKIKFPNPATIHNWRAVDAASSDNPNAETKGFKKIKIPNRPLAKLS